MPNSIRLDTFLEQLGAVHVQSVHQQLMAIFDSASIPSINLIPRPLEPFCAPRYLDPQVRKNTLAITYTGLQVAGFLDNNQHSQDQLFIKRAAFFALYGVGNCASRSAYAAIVLRQLLPEDIKIVWQGNAQKDHFVLLLGNKDRGYFVFDPLINYEAVFPFTSYQNEMFRLYPDRPHPNQQTYKMNISERQAVFLAQCIQEYAIQMVPRFKAIDFKACEGQFIAANLTNPILRANFNNVGVKKEETQTQLMSEAIALFQQANSVYDPARPLFPSKSEAPHYLRSPISSFLLRTEVDISVLTHTLFSSNMSAASSAAAQPLLEITQQESGAPTVNNLVSTLIQDIRGVTHGLSEALIDKTIEHLQNLKYGVAFRLVCSMSNLEVAQLIFNACEPNGLMDINEVSASKPKTALDWALSSGTPNIALVDYLKSKGAKTHEELQSSPAVLRA